MDKVDDTRIALLGGFDLIHLGIAVSLPLAAQRLLAYLALQESSHRAAAAVRLWPDCSPARAAANLRSALWRCKKVGLVNLIHSMGPRLRLSPIATVDLLELRCWASRITQTSNPPLDSDLYTIVAGLSRELLPSWSDEWLLLEREHWNNMRLHTLEYLAQHLLTTEHYLPALQTALAATSIEPVRETAHRTIVQIHTAEGNIASAIKHYHSYRSLLQRELGVNPSPRMTQLARSLMQA